MRGGRILGGKRWPVFLAAGLLAFVLLVGPALAQETNDLEEALSGFEETAPTAEEGDLEDVLDQFGDQAPEAGQADATSGASPNILPRPSWLDLNGGISLLGVCNLAHQAPQAGQTDHRGLSSLRARASLEADVRLSLSWRARASGHAFYDLAYAIRGREDYTDQVLDEYEQEVELDEAYIQGSLLPQVDIKVGRQIVVWGKSDNLRVTDILNPIDNRRLGLTDIEELRLPVAMTRLDAYLGPWDLCGLVIHEVRFNKTPVYGSDFYPAPTPAPEDKKPGAGIDNQQYALALNGTFSGWDLSLYAASVFDQESHLEMTAAGLEGVHGRIYMAGLAADVVMGSWLMKGETAFLHGLEFLALPDEKMSRLDLLLGVEYSGFAETSIALEAVCRHIIDFDQRLEGGPDDAREDDFQWAFRLNRDFLNDRLTLTLLASAFDALAQGGAFERLQLDYELTDSLLITLGLVLYQSGDRAFTENIGDNDRLFGQIRYSF
ncbi:MAG: DUF1302 family protein [Deltaproteobacteria bacterium]|nr:DUF1302 family protein [Deltaproteobacteria bacterium]